MKKNIYIKLSAKIIVIRTKIQLINAVIDKKQITFSKS